MTTRLYQNSLFPVFQGHIVKPKGVSIAVLAQYGVMPLTAFCFVKVGTFIFYYFTKNLKPPTV